MICKFGFENILDKLKGFSPWQQDVRVGRRRSLEIVAHEVDALDEVVRHPKNVDPVNAEEPDTDVKRGKHLLLH